MKPRLHEPMTIEDWDMWCWRARRLINLGIPGPFMNGCRLADRRDARLMLHFATYGVELCRHERMWAMAGGVPAWDGFETVLELLPHPVGHWAIP